MEKERKELKRHLSSLGNESFCVSWNLVHSKIAQCGEKFEPSCIVHSLQSLYRAHISVVSAICEQLGAADTG